MFGEIRVKKIKNPLTIIGLFAGIAEIAGTTVLPLVSDTVQSIFIWYVMGFPVLLVVLFFLTLNFNPKVLYSPSDFADEKNFMALLTQITQAVDGVIATSPDIEEQLKPVETAIEAAAMQTGNVEMNTYQVKDNTHSSGCNLLLDKIECIVDSGINRAYLLYGEKKIYLRKTETLIGRSPDTDVVINAPTVSRIHCIISKTPDGSYFIRDCSAINGIKLNGTDSPRDSSILLRNGDDILIGKTNLKFIIENIL